MPKMKHPLRLTRLSDAFVPLALAICALLLEPSISLRLFVGCFAVSALSLFSCFGVRDAFAMQPSMRSVRGTVKCALLLQIAGGIIAALVGMLLSLIAAVAGQEWKKRRETKKGNHHGGKAKKG